MTDIKKVKKLIIKGVLKPKVFFILFGLFFSSLAFAATLSVEFIGALIPGGNNNTPRGNVAEQQCRGNDTSKTLMHTDRTTSPTDIEFNDDGSFVYTSNFSMSGMSNNSISQNKLLKPYQILSDAIRSGTFNCDHLKGADPRSQSGFVSGNKTQDIEIHQNGRLFFFLDDSRNLTKFTASTPYDLNTLTFNAHTDLNGKDNSIEFNKDGTQIFALNNDLGDVHVATYQLPGAYDISSITEIESIDLVNFGIEDIDGEDEIGQDIEFNSDGSVMFVMVGNSDIEQEYIYHFDLAIKYDVSTAVKAGRFHVGAIFMNRAAGDRFGNPGGFGFSRDGMNLYLLDGKTSTGVHQINQYKLDCPYGLVKCSSDSSASIESQVELSKQNISLNVSTIFKRFEWIKRNRDKENLPSHNININYPNPLLKALAQQLQPTVKKNLISFASKSQKNEKKSKWSSWSLGDLSMNTYDKHGLQKAKEITSKGLTFGTDRKFGDNKFFGLALRYGGNKSNIIGTKQNAEMESLTLNIYGIIPIKEDQYVNAVIGLSALRFDNKYLGKLSGERNGKQAFASINYRTQNSYGKFNVTPTGKLTFGITRLSSFTDFLSNAIDSPTTNIIYAEDTFESGELSAGFLFEMDKTENEHGTFQPMGGIEILYDLSPNVDYKYNYVGSTEVNKDTILGKYARRSLKTDIGFEMITLNGLTISPIYERIIRLNSSTQSDNEKQRYSERFIVKLSRSKEEDNSDFALDFDPLSDNPANLSYVKNFNGLDFKLNSKFDLKDNVNYLTNFEVSGKF